MKSFTFTAVWAKRPRQYQPQTKRGVVGGSSIEDAEHRIRSYWQFKGVERLALVEVTETTLEVILA